VTAQAEKRYRSDLVKVDDGLRCLGPD
jgi:hypothetical protein